LIQEEIKSRLNSGNCLLPFSPKPSVFSFAVKNLKIRICKTVILPSALYGCEPLSPTLWEEDRLRVLENRLLRRIFGRKRVEVTGEWRKLHNEEFVICTLRQV
jgi:hypothetical protein